ncbi:MAG: DMT family transporter [Caulobacteraceae bacterium]
MRLSSHTKALLVLVLGGAIIGFSAILVRLTHTGPAAAGLWRLSFALPLLLLASALRQRGARARAAPAPLTSRKVLVIAGVMFAADLLCWHYGLHLTSVANATVLANLTPVVITVFAWLVFKEQPARLFLAALTLAVGGAATMALAEHGGGGHEGSNPLLGDALSTITTLWYGGYFLAVRQARKTAGVMTIMIWSTAVGVPLMLVAAILLGEPILPTAASGWLACIGLGLVHVGGQGCIAWSLGRLSAALAAIVMLVQPIVAALLGWALLGEPVSWLQAAGAGVALAGICPAQLSTRQPSAPTAGDGAQVG